jgi:release factor glutamine methyltransferase
MTISEAIKDIAGDLKKIYDDSESLNIATWVVEFVTGYDRTISAHAGTIEITDTHIETMNAILKRLLHHEPVQYVLNEAWFYGMKFYVDEHVLIPRPETEELVEWVIRDCHVDNELNVLDIGTGSGCIAVVLKKKMPGIVVWACDSSEAALTVARQNAELRKVDIHYKKVDFLDRESWPELPLFEVIVSNPPYVTIGEKDSMQENVLKFEPATALFVPDEDPLVFYKAIVDFAKTHLKPGGKIYVEINESLGTETKEIFTQAGFGCEIKKDLQGKERLIKVQKV